MNIEVDTAHPLAYGMETHSYGFYNNSPFFSLLEGFSSQKLSIVARYPNTDGALWPGQFADVTLVLGTQVDATTIPASAVMTGQQGPYVFTLEADGTAGKGDVDDVAHVPAEQRGPQRRVRWDSPLAQAVVAHRTGRKLEDGHALADLDLAVVRRLHERRLTPPAHGATLAHRSPNLHRA